MKTYTYKDNIYNNLYDLAEALAHNGTFIPRTISDTDLEQLGVVVAEAEEPIEYGGHLYDYDSKARDRIAAAIIALDVQGEGASISWTTADNDDVVVTVQDLRAIVAAVAVRSNLLHIAYRTAKAQVEAAQKAEIDAISIKVDLL